ncbi:hypothetical protein [Thermococcus eurythermalis]|nr:hypothetical protein [Thermococcus eurythermalis]
MSIDEGMVSVPELSFLMYRVSITPKVKWDIELNSSPLPQVELKEPHALALAVLNDSLFEKRHNPVLVPFISLDSPSEEVPVIKVDSNVYTPLHTTILVPPIELPSAKISSEINFEPHVMRRQLSIPKLELDERPNLNIEVKVESEISDFRHASVIPQVRLSLTKFKILSVELDSEIPVVDFSISVPLLNINPLSSPQIGQVVNVTTEVKFHAPRGPIVPYLRLRSLEDTTRGADNVAIDAEIKITPKTEPRTARILTQERRELVSRRIKQDSSVRPVEVEATSNPEVGSGEGSSELKDPLEVLFGAGVGKIRDLEPLVILFEELPDDSYKDTFTELLLRIYREKHGGYPEVKELSLDEEWNKQEIERWLDEGKIFLIDLDGGEDAKINERLLADRLWAIFSKRKGIVIFYTRDMEKFKKYKRMLTSPSGINWRDLHFKLRIVEVHSPKLSINEKRKLASLIYGYGIKIKLPDIDIMTFTDSIFNMSKEEYEKKLKKLVGKYSIVGIINEAEDKKGTENESPEHYAGKVFIVNYLIKKLQEEEEISKDFNEIEWDKVEREYIWTETPIKVKDESKKIVPDVTFVPEGEHYEFETLFGEGFSKISGKTLKKYHKYAPNSKVRIVVEPITAFLHMNEFSTLIKLIKKGNRFGELDVRFYTFDVEKERLLDLESYLRELRKFLKEISKHRTEEAR